MEVIGCASSLVSLPISNKVSLLTRVQTPRPSRGIHNVEYQWKQKDDTRSNHNLFPDIDRMIVYEDFR